MPALNHPCLNQMRKIAVAVGISCGLAIALLLSLLSPAYSQASQRLALRMSTFFGVVKSLSTYRGETDYDSQ
jgi:hypothetical protein